MKFTVNKISGFYCPDNFIQIFDENGIPFYFLKNRTKTFFNLPIGVYMTKNTVEKLDAPVIYSLPELAKAERMAKPPGKFKIIFRNNPNKCTVYIQLGIIIFDNSFRNAPRFIIDYILLHEIGHYRYAGNGQESEKKCDTFARYWMLKLGYNPSQFHLAIKLSLSDDYLANIRKDLSKNHLKKTKQKVK